MKQREETFVIMKAREEQKKAREKEMKNVDGKIGKLKYQRLMTKFEEADKEVDVPDKN
jgi:hypothetical protein